MTTQPAIHANFLDPSAAAGGGERIAATVLRGAQRLLRQNGFESLAEFPLGNGRRADLLAVGPAGEIHIIEIKSCFADFNSDQKWPEYRDYCDLFSFAVAPAFPIDVLPASVGLIIADAYGGDIARRSDHVKIAAARRKATLLAFARTAAMRLQALRDPSQKFENA